MGKYAKIIYNKNASRVSAGVQVAFLCLLSCGLLICIPYEGIAQEMTVSGKVLYNPLLNDCFKEKPCMEVLELTSEEEWIPPKAAVNIVVKGTDRRTKTDREGNYEITVPSPDASLMFLYIGHNRIEVPVEGRDVVDIKLTPTPIPVIDKLIQLIMPKIHSGQRPNIDELAEQADVNRETAREFLWLVLGNRPFSEMYPDEYIPDYRFDENLN